MTAVVRTTSKGDNPLSSPGYDTDFAAWAFAEAAKLRRLAASGAAGDLDVDNIIEELETLGRTERREIIHRLSVLVMHLLKQRFQPEKSKGGWLATIKVQRMDLKRVLKDNPSLKSLPRDALADDYPYMRARAAAETGLPESTFPATCPFTIDDILDDGFFGQSSNE